MFLLHYFFSFYPHTLWQLTVFGTFQLNNRVTKNKKKTVSNKSSDARNGYPIINNGTNIVKTEQQEVAEANPLQGRERNLKEVLTNLHDEFEALNK